MELEVDALDVLVCVAVEVGDFVNDLVAVVDLDEVEVEEAEDVAVRDVEMDFVTLAEEVDDAVDVCVLVVDCVFVSETVLEQPFSGG